MQAFNLDLCELPPQAAALREDVRAFLADWRENMALDYLAMYSFAADSESADAVTPLVRMTADNDVLAGFEIGDDKATADGTPEPGTVYYYLVRAENGCGPGPLGADRSAMDCTP